MFKFLKKRNIKEANEVDSSSWLEETRKFSVSPHSKNESIDSSNWMNEMRKYANTLKNT